MKNKRGEARIRVDMEIRFRYPKIFHARVRNYSKGGIGVEVPITLKVDAPIELEIFKSSFLVEGKVRWVQKGENDYTAGIQFKENALDLIEGIHASSGSFT